MQSASQRKTIKKTDLPQHRHGLFLDAQERAALAAFKLVHYRLVKEIEKTVADAVMEKSLKSEFELLAKADRLMRRWTGKVPRINLSLSERIEAIIKRHLLALRYLLLGKYAGRAAKDEAAKQFGTKVPPGLIFATYLHAIDTERKYYEKIYSKDAPVMPMTLIQKSFELIKRQSERMIDQSLDDYKNRLLDVVDVGLAQHRFDNLFAVADKAHDVKDQHTKPGAVEHAVEKVVEEIQESELVSELDKLTEKASGNFDRTVKTCLGTVTAVGAHQAMVEMFGGESNFMKAALVNIRDGKCCDHCERLSRNRDGSLKLYDLEAFAPAGSNNYKKRSEWILCIPPLHPNCRCFIVHVPKGFTIDENGNVTVDLNGDEQ